jgi:hypothetical protein
MGDRKALSKACVRLVVRKRVAAVAIVLDVAEAMGQRAYRPLCGGKTAYKLTTTEW